MAGDWERKYWKDLSEGEVNSALDHAFPEAKRPKPQPQPTRKVVQKAPNQPTRNPLQFTPLHGGEGEWFIESNGKAVGPLSATQMRYRWATGQIGPDTNCWGHGCT